MELQRGLPNSSDRLANPGAQPRPWHQESVRVSATESSCDPGSLDPSTGNNAEENRGPGSQSGVTSITESSLGLEWATKGVLRSSTLGQNMAVHNLGSYKIKIIRCFYFGLTLMRPETRGSKSSNPDCSTHPALLKLQKRQTVGKKIYPVTPGRGPTNDFADD